MKLMKHIDRLLLLTTSALLAPTVAFAQEQPQQPASPPPAAEQPGVASQEVIVLGRNIPEPMRQTSEVVTVLSAADLARTGDSNAAEALTRLSGLSVAQGRFVFVRGLGDRYSAALLNGSSLPSPEPLRRTVPLDLFPSNILSGATVQKTYSPNYPGEFGGGIIDLKTVKIPNKPFFDAKIGAGLNDATTGQSALLYKGGKRDWLGFDDGLRDLPGPLAAAVRRPTTLGSAGFTDRQLEQIGESLVNSPLSVIQSRDAPVDLDMELNAGTSFDRGDVNIGLVGVFGLSGEWTTRDALRQVGTTTIPLGRDQRSYSTSYDVTTNALGSAAVRFGDHEISATGFYVHAATREAQITEGVDFNAPANANGDPLTARESTAWYERELVSLQLAGEHEFGALELEWRGSTAQSTRNAPYERDVTFLVGADGVQFYGRSNNNTIRFADLKDQVASGGVDAKYTFALSDQRDAVISGGIAYSNTVRNFDQLRFLFGGGSNLPADVARARVDFLFGPDNIDPARFVLLELTGPDDSYKGQLRTSAAYLGADVEFLPLIRAAIGVRVEDARQVVRTLNRFNAPTARTRGAIEEQYVLPAGTLTWNFAEDLQLRVGASKTIARPQFRELASSPFIDPESDRTYRGNPFLLDTEFMNYDARLEYYLGRNQFVTAAAFYKDVTGPIEEVQSETSTLNFETSFINAPKAVIYGAELEYRTKFEWSPFDWEWTKDKEWLFNINYTYTFSEVQAEAGDRVFDPLRAGERRPASDFALNGARLQGTPEHLANIQFGYDGPNTQLTALVGYVSERILARGAGGLSDLIEKPGVNLDLVYRHNFEVAGRDLTLGVSGRNLLDTEHSETLKTPAGKLDFNTYDRGRSLSVSLSAKF